MIQSW
ncbi:hypothetical protein LINPERPRIM_LOCUS8798 [Linum perenne]